MNLISHSWGTTLTYDLQNVSGIPVRHWVTMGSPLKSTTPKPPGNTGMWINCLDPKDKVVGLEMYPPFPDVNGLPLPSFGPGLLVNPSVNLQLSTYNFQAKYGEGWWVHSGYWISPAVATDLRRLLK